MTIVARPLHQQETDLLKGNKHLPLKFEDPQSKETIMECEPPASSGWTHDALESVNPPNTHQWNAYVGTHWVGSSEI